MDPFLKCTSALEQAHGMFVVGRFFDDPALDELAGIKRLSKAEKVVDDCLRALDALGEDDLPLPQSLSAVQPQSNFIGINDAFSSSASTSSASLKPGKANKARKRQREYAVPTSVQPIARPPHMDRHPVVNETCAAKIASHELWILAVVLRTNLDGGLFHVRDFEGDRSFTLARSQLLTLPAEKEMQGGTKWIVNGLRVMAMYPETTSFYPGVIISVDAGAACSILFDDDDDEAVHSVPLRFITLRA